MNYAIVDIGSNTVKMSIFTEEGARLAQKTRTLGLIGRMQKNLLTREGIEALVDALLAFRQSAAEWGCERLFPFATASLRAAENRFEIVNEIKTRVGCLVEIVDGEKEAALSLAGIRFAAGAPLGCGVLLDMGGGSCEVLSFGEKEGARPLSLPVGALSLHARFVRNILPTKEETDAIRAYVFKTAKEAGLGPVPGELFAVGGTIRALAALSAAEKGEPAPPSLPFVITESEAESLLCRVTAMTIETKLLLLRLAPERIHTLPAGLAAYLALLPVLGKERITVVEGGAREGYFLEVRKREKALCAFKAEERADRSDGTGEGAEKSKEPDNDVYQGGGK